MRRLPAPSRTQRCEMLSDAMHYYPLKVHTFQCYRALRNVWRETVLKCLVTSKLCWALLEEVTDDDCLLYSTY